jgi:hypothetical protein
MIADDVRAPAFARSSAFSASSRLIDLNGETNNLKRKKSSAIIVAVTRFLHHIKRMRFSAHTRGEYLIERSKRQRGAIMQGARKSFRAEGPPASTVETGRYWLAATGLPPKRAA